MESSNDPSHKHQEDRVPSRQVQRPRSKKVIASDPARCKAMESSNSPSHKHLEDGCPSLRVKRLVEVAMALPSLPEDLVENILARVPFPYTFKARVLSKAWLARLSPISSQHNEEMKSIALGFQKTMFENCMKGKAFSPIFAGYDDFFVYGQESQVWHRMPALSLISGKHLKKDIHSYADRLYIEGALLLLVKGAEGYLQPSGTLSVINALSSSWKELPGRPSFDRLVSYDVLRLGPTTFFSHDETCTVIELYTSPWYHYSALIYNSKLGAWKWKRVEVPIKFTTSGDSVYLCGVVYWLVCSPHKRVRNWNLLTFNVEEETFDTLQIPTTDIPKRPYDTDNLLVCNGSMFLTALTSGNRVKKFYEHVIVQKFDPVSQTLVKVTEGPPAALEFGKFWSPLANQGNYIFFLGENGDKVLAYDTSKDDWSSFPIPANVSESYNRGCCKWVSSSFQPGLNPFLAL